MAGWRSFVAAIVAEHDRHAQDSLPEGGAMGDLLAIEAMDWLAEREGRRGVLALIRAGDTGPVMDDATENMLVKVYAWRRDALLQLDPSLDVARAEVLAVCGIDVHEVARLVRSGCPFEVAVEIVR